LIASAIARIVLFRQYWKAAPEGDDVLGWERPYFVTLILSSSIWGIGSIFIMPVDSMVHQVAIYYFLIGMSGGAISVYSAHRLMVLATIAVILLPVTGWFLLQGSLMAVGMGIGSLIFVVSAIRAGKVLSIALHNSFKLTHELKDAKEAAEKMALVDELTGLANRRAFNEQGQLFFELCQRSDKQLSMIVMDIDFFKKINDSCGHAVGDETLRKIGEVLRRAMRKSDVFSRIGGEEFGMLLKVTTLDEAIQVAEKLRKLIAEVDVKCDDGHLTITASFGVAVADSDLETLFKHADEALYDAKEGGRNQVVSYKSGHVT